jgi:hypothetical protein
MIGLPWPWSNRDGAYFNEPIPSFITVHHEDHAAWTVSVESGECVHELSCVWKMYASFSPVNDAGGQGRFKFLDTRL